MTAGMEIDCADECIDGQIEAAESLLSDFGFTPDDPDTCACRPSRTRCRPWPRREG